MNRKILAIFLTAFLLILITALIPGCGGKTYRGKYITVSVPYYPIDEFQYEDWTILAFQKPGQRPEEGEIYRFWLFKDGKKQRELWLSVKIVNRRMFFLQEQIGDNIVSHASFIAPPSYDAVKERIKALLTSETVK
ncbi:hypothetical protein J7L68_06845 [bacterium]|nr:hypothetical protein [bacterium]